MHFIVKMDNFGIVTFCSKNYYNITSKLLDSIYLFSSFNTTVFTTDFEKTDKYNDRTDFINLNTGQSNWTSCLYNKFLACSKSPFDITFYLDGDIIITKEFEPWIKSLEKQLEQADCGLFTKHPNSNCFNKQSHLYRQLDVVYSFIGAKEVNTYLFAAAFGYNSKFKKHLEEMYKICLNLGNINPITGDENVLNGYISKNKLDVKITDYDFIPFFLHTFDKYIDNKPLNNSIEYKNVDVRGYLFHGQKCVDGASKMILKINDKPVVTT